MKNWTELADENTLQKTIAALQANGIETSVVQTGPEAKELVKALLPLGAEVMNMTSVTLDTIGVADSINESGQYDSVKKKLSTMNRETQSKEMQKLGAAPDYVVGSVHAVTQTGQVFVASHTGSQLPAYAYGSSHVIWVVGTQKIVADEAEAKQRIYEYTLPLESERAKKIYGSEGSSVSKLLIFNKEKPGRIKIIFVAELLGY